MILEIIMDHAALFHVSQTHFSSNRVHSFLIHRHQPPRCPNLPHRCPERQKRQLGDLEELLANIVWLIVSGIPMIVMHHRQPDNTHASPLKSPPQTNQSMFPSMLM